MRRSAERALGAAQAFANAEASYARALATASQIPLTGGADGGPLRDMLVAFRALPQAVGLVHEEVRHLLSPAWVLRATLRRQYSSLLNWKVMS